MDAFAAFTNFDASRLTDWDILIRLVIQFILFALSAFFSSSETALFSLSKMDLQRLRRQRSSKASKIQRLLDEPRELIVSILCGNELINIAASANLAGILFALYGDPGVAAVFNIVIMFPLLLLFGEITPKTIAIGDPVGLSTRLIAAPLTVWVSISAPLRFVVRLVSEGVTNLIVGGRGGSDILGVDEFRTLLSDVEENGIMSLSERTLIENLIRASEIEIREIMVPRPRVRFIDADEPTETMIENFRRSRYDRMPVYRGHRDTIVGFLHSEDVLRLVRDGNPADVAIEDIVRPAVVVPKTKKVDEMFDLFKSRNARAALVVSEFGGVDGFISMTNIVEFVLSDLVEFAPDHNEFCEVEPGVWELSGLLKIKHFDALTNEGLTDPQMTTMGGYLLRNLDRLPGQGEQITIDGLCFEVLEIDDQLISRIRVSRSKDAAPGHPPGAVPSSPDGDPQDVAPEGGEFGSGRAPQRETQSAAE